MWHRKKTIQNDNKCTIHVLLRRFSSLLPRSSFWVLLFLVWLHSLLSFPPPVTPSLLILPFLLPFLTRLLSFSLRPFTVLPISPLRFLIPVIQTVLGYSCKKMNDYARNQIRKRITKICRFFRIKKNTIFIRCLWEYEWNSEKNVVHSTQPNWLAYTASRNGYKIIQWQKKCELYQANENNKNHQQPRQTATSNIFTSSCNPQSQSKHIYTHCVWYAHPMWIQSQHWHCQNQFRCWNEHVRWAFE